MVASAASSEAKISFTPTIRLFTERLVVGGGDALSPSYGELVVPVLRLSFDYQGTLLRASDPRRQFFVSDHGGLRPVERDVSGESQAQRVLEGFGAVELGHLDSYGLEEDSEADYVVQVDGNVHTWCSFTAYALPQLRSLGWRVEVDPAYPYQVIEENVPWYSRVEPAEQADWFSLELGVEIEGGKVNLLPALLEVLEESGGASTLDSLMRIPARFRAVHVASNQFLTLPPERLRVLLEVLIELYRGDGLETGPFRFPGLAASSLAKLEDALSSGGTLLRREGHAPVRQRGKALGATLLIKPELLARGLKADLRPYQQEGLTWLQQLREQEAGGILADDMGLGKTLQTIAHLALEKEAGRMVDPSLVVMPTSLIGNWKRELARFAPALRVAPIHGPSRAELHEKSTDADVVLMTYPILLRDLDKFADRHFHLLILDEAQAIKNRRSLVHRAVKSLSATHRLCLSGTPIENNLDELWSMFDFLNPGLLGEAEEFRIRFRYAIEREGDVDQAVALRGRVAPFILRRMKETVAKDLPPKTELVRPVELLGDQRELYESIRIAAHADVRRAVKKSGLVASTIAILDALMKLRQVCCDPRLLSVDAARKVRTSAKYDLFFQLLATQLEQGRRVLVFSQFARMLALLSDGLLARDISHVVLTGKTADRQKPIDAFTSGKADVFLISLKAGGTGLNLTRADTVIHYDPWWNPAAQAQATDRAYRIGQTRPVFVYSLIAAGSVEERMLGLQQSKRDLAEAIIGPARPRTSLSPDEVETLFAPLTS